MADKPSTQDTIKNLLGDIADSSNKAFNDFLDPPNKSRKSDFPDWFGSGNPMAALAGTPLGALQAMAAFGGGVNPVAALAGANPLALLAGASSDRGSGPVNPLAALANANPLAVLAGANPAAALAGLSASSNSANPLAAFGQLAGAAAGLPAAVGGLGGLAESLATLPQQIAKLTDLLSTLVGALDTISDVAASTGVRPPAKKG
ncbi:hypothetical protein [Streptomyces sp. NBC_00989]|uniref:hypothetical protein n=1 Tax=Streptomyces sp. NBC_00989 TaxID=2903705 RepID=UPI00386B20AC|nr:hypothetical protein OG714_08900 [Streptomyces sp. NBC_00989]